MLNREIAWHLQTISVLLELKEENFFKIKAYRNAAREIKRLTRPIRAMLEDGSLSHVEGIGPGIISVVLELATTGESSLLRELREQVSPALVELGSIPGIGAKTASALVRHLGIQNVSELEAAAEVGKVRQIAGFGEKKEQAILSGIKLLRSRGTLSPIGTSRPLAEALARLLRQCDWVFDAQIAGSVRRWQELNADVDLVASVDDTNRVIKFLAQIKGLKVIDVSDQSIILSTSMDISVRIWLVPRVEFARYWLTYTGSKEHVAALSALGQLNGATEGEIYSNLGLHYIPPEMRQPGIELDLYSLALSPPQLVDGEDIRGDLHLHTLWSDGVLDIPTLAKLAASQGYDYIAITDHSPSLAIARGLSFERLQQQLSEIRSQQHTFPLTVLAGIEVDIKSDGSLDLPDGILVRLDWVVASVHSLFGLGPEAMTNRVVAAMENPYVNALGHATGRLLQRRPGYELDWERVFAAARENNVAIEVNSSPDRLDINDELIREAINRGVKIVVNTDAHSGNELNNMRFGLATARRGGATKADIINCMPLAQLNRHIKNKPALG